MNDFIHFKEEKLIFACYLSLFALKNVFHISKAMNFPYIHVDTQGMVSNDKSDVLASFDFLTLAAVVLFKDESFQTCSRKAF